MTLAVDPHRLIRNTVLFCLACEGLLVALDVFVYYGAGTSTRGLRSLFNIASEQSLGTWFSSTQTLAVAVVLWLIRLRLRSTAGATTGRVTGWTLLAVFFTYMAVDDAVALHEHLGSAFEDFYTDLDEGSLGAVGRWLEDYPSYAWQLAVGPLFAAMGLFLLFFLWRQLEQPWLRLLLLAALGCFAVAVGLDYVEGVYGGYKSVIVATGWDYDAVQHGSRVIEEFIEMFGTTLFLALFLSFFSRPGMDIHLFFAERHADHR